MPPERTEDAQVTIKRLRDEISCLSRAIVSLERYELLRNGKSIAVKAAPGRRKASKAGAGKKQVETTEGNELPS
jgi:hypothetical protein